MKCPPKTLKNLWPETTGLTNFLRFFAPPRPPSRKKLQRDNDDEKKHSEKTSDDADEGAECTPMGAVTDIPPLALGAPHVNKQWDRNQKKEEKMLTQLLL